MGSGAPASCARRRSTKASRSAPGARLDGPAIVELANTTIVVLAAFQLSVDAYGTFVLAAGAARERGAAGIAEALRA